MGKEFDGVGYFLNIPAAVARDKRMSSKMLLVIFGELYALQNVYPDDYLFISNERIAGRYGFNKNSVSNAVSKLVEYGYLTRKVVYKEGTKEVEKRLLKVNVKQ